MTVMSAEDESEGGDVGISNNVYIRSDEYGWIPAKVVESSESEATVSIPIYHEEQFIQSDGGKHAKGSDERKLNLADYPNKAFPLQNVDEKGVIKEVEDMVDLPFLHEAAILYNLKARHVKGKPYTRTGDIVIAVNPYQWMNELYSQERRNLYANTLVWDGRDEEVDPRSSVEPHVYETSSLAYRGLAMEGRDQSVLVSGESGAGKTETVKILMSHLASVQSGVQSSSFKEDGAAAAAIGATQHNSHSPIVQRVLDSNPLLEAFGNAKTVRNDNSSRFGKYIQLQFDAEDPTHAAFSGKNMPSCILAGSNCEVYLLEKSRVVGHEEEERTYHIFYQLLAAPEETKIGIWSGLEDTDMESFNYVGWTDTEVIEGKTDAERFQLTVDALALVGVEGESLKTLFRAICIVMQLGNLVFEPHADDEEKSDITSTEELEALAELMGVPEEDIKNSLTLRTVRARNEEYKVPLKSVQAKDSCDAFAKEIYAKAFLWLVRTINTATCAENNYDRKLSNFAIIGLLDIFGFESFDVNRFEQLCINYANEKLQQKFTQDIFRSVQAEYEFEGIELGEIKYDDNVDVLNLVEGRMGLVAVLNEECVRPKGNDTAFVNKIIAMNKDAGCLIAEKAFHDYEFGIKHYAGAVVYDATNFVTKNMDNLPRDLQDCALKSSNDIVSMEVRSSHQSTAGVKTGGRRKRPTTTGKEKRAPSRKGSLVQETVCTKFRSQLTTLMENLGETRSRYIRCIKPNALKKPRLMQHLSTIEQLRCAGVVAAVTISRSAFPNRLEHEILLDRFKSLFNIHHHSLDIDASKEDTLKEVDELLTPALQPLEVRKDGEVAKAFVIGKTRTYFRAGALEFLEAERLKGLSNWATQIQRIVRGYVAHVKYHRIRQGTIRIQSLVRRIISLERFRLVIRSCIILQCWMRRRIAISELIRRREAYKATLIQTHWRMAVAITALKRSRKAAVQIQAIARGAIQRPKYLADIKEKREEAKLENQLKALQRKLDEAEARRIEAEEKAKLAEEEALKQPPPEAKDVPEESAPVPPKPAASGEGASVPRTTASTGNSVGIPAPVVGQLTAQQQTLMDESGKMLEYLRKEVFKLRSQNTQLRTDFDLLKENNQRLMDANASAGASFAALNQHAKQLNKTNVKLVTEISNFKQQIHRLNMTQVELKEELKMKQAAYVAEVHSRLEYQKTMIKIVDSVQERCRDTRLVEDVLTWSDECEAVYTHNSGGGYEEQDSHFESNTLAEMASPQRQTQSTGFSGRIKSFFG